MRAQLMVEGFTFTMGGAMATFLIAGLDFDVLRTMAAVFVTALLAVLICLRLSRGVRP